MTFTRREGEIVPVAIVDRVSPSRPIFLDCGLVLEPARKEPLRDTGNHPQFKTYQIIFLTRCDYVHENDDRLLPVTVASRHRNLWYSNGFAGRASCLGAGDPYHTAQGKNYCIPKWFQRAQENPCGGNRFRVQCGVLNNHRHRHELLRCSFGRLFRMERGC